MAKQYFQKYTAFDYNPRGNTIPSILGNTAGTITAESGAKLVEPLMEGIRKDSKDEN